jgi:hypothetical protein
MHSSPNRPGQALSELSPILLFHTAHAGSLSVHSGLFLDTKGGAPRYSLLAVCAKGENDKESIFDELK